MEGLIVYRDVIEKAKQHKYLRKEIDVNGGILYIYKELSKENKKEDINLKKIKDYANEVIKGRLRIIGFSKGETKGCISGGRRNVEAAILITTIKGSDEDGLGINKEREKALKEYAIKTGCWFDDFDKKYNDENFVGNGSEAKVFEYDKDYVIKRVDYGMVHRDSIVDFFHRIAIHNLLFNSVKYELLGFTKGGVGYSALNVILKQKTVKNITIASEREIKDYMISAKFSHISEDSYKDKFYRIDDLNTTNVLKNGKSGSLYFIDPMISIIEENSNIRKALDDKLTIYQDNIEKAKHYENVSVHRDGKLIVQRRLVGTDEDLLKQKENIKSKYGYEVSFINKKPKGYLGKHYFDTKIIEIYTKDRTKEQLVNALNHEVGHIIDYKRRGIAPDPMGDSLIGYDGKLRPASDSDIYFRYSHLKSEADAIRKEFPRTDAVSTTQKEIWADVYKLYITEAERLKDIAPFMYKIMDTYLNESK